MKIGLKPENPLDALGLALGLVPVPMGETLPPLLLTRTLMAAARFGVIEALAEGPRTAGEIARMGLDRPAGRVSAERRAPAHPPRDDPGPVGALSAGDARDGQALGLPGLGMQAAVKPR